MQNANEKMKYFTKQEMIRLLDTIQNYRCIHALRNLSIFRVAYRCGLRASEIGILKLEDYNIDKGELYCKRLKGSNNNTIRLDIKTKETLDKYIIENHITLSSEILFKSQKNKPISRFTLNYLTKKYCLLAKIDDPSKYHFHTIKHTTAVHLADSNMDIKELQWWLGHKSVSNTEIYFQFTTRQQDKMYAKLEENNEMA